MFEIGLNESEIIHISNEQQPPMWKTTRYYWLLDIIITYLKNEYQIKVESFQIYSVKSITCNMST